MMHDHFRERTPVSGPHSELRRVLKDDYNKHLIANTIVFLPFLIFT